MESLRSGIQKLKRFPVGQTLNVGEVAQFMGMDKPVSLADMSHRLNALPDAVPFHETIVTDTALGGEVNLTLQSDGSYTFAGSMRATGLPSFSFRLVAVLRSPTGNVVAVAQHTGEVFGSDTPGPRNNDWNEPASDPDQMKLIRNVWPDISAGHMTVSRSSELAGTLGTVVDVAEFLGEFVAGAVTLGTGPAVCLVIGSELGTAGVLPGLSGVVGLGVVGGVVFIWGPSSIVAAVVAGVAAGAIVDAMVKVRTLSPSEGAFARQVFGDTLDFARIRLTNLSGLGGRAFTTPTFDGTILVNIGNSFDAPSSAVFKNGYSAPGQILIHELTHAWQIQHASLADGFVPGLMCQGILNQTVVSNPYEYGPAGPPWHCFGMEAQGAIVDQWFGGNGLQPGRQMDRDSRYFGYIANNILLGAP